MNIPSSLTSIKDGYAIRSQDLEFSNQEFEIQYKIRAGDDANLCKLLLHGKTCYVTTGSPLPPGADAVIEIEKTRKVSDSRMMCLISSIQIGHDVRLIGSDLKVGELVLKQGMLLGPPELGALAMLGMFHSIPVFAQPRVGVMATGNELAKDETLILQPGQVYDCNRPMLLSALSECGCIGVDLGQVEDSPDVILERFHSPEVDFVLSTGGVSEGDADFVGMLLSSAPFELLFNRVKIKPGKPLTCAIISEPNQRMIVGLPGNPVSVFAMFHTFVAPLLRKLAHRASVDCPHIYTKTNGDIQLDNRPEFQRVVLSRTALNQGQIICHPTGFQRSSRVMSLVACDALVALPAAQSLPGGVLPKGSVVPTFLFALERQGFDEVKANEVLLSTSVTPQKPVDALVSPPSHHTPHFRILVLHVAHALASCDFRTTSQHAKEVEKLAETQATVTQKTIEITQLPRVLTHCHADLILLSAEPGIHRYCHEITRLRCRLLLHGVPQYLRENLEIWEEMIVGVVTGKHSTVIVDMSASEREVLPGVFQQSWPLLREAMLQLKDL